jgi:hypothetical protein
MKVFRALEEAALGKAVKYAVCHRLLVLLLPALYVVAGEGYHRTYDASMKSGNFCMFMGT